MCWFSLDILKFMCWHLLGFFYAVFILSRFCLTTDDSHGTLHSARGLISMHFAAASMREMMEFSYSSFSVCVPDISWSASNFFLIVTVYLLLISLLVSSYVRIRDVALNTCQRRWTIGRSGERGSGISVLAARHDDDESLADWVLNETGTHSCS